MRGHGAKFTRKMDEAVAALLVHRTLEEAARAVGVGTATLIRWQNSPVFQAAYRAARRQAYGQSIARLQQGCSAAATTVLKIMLDPTSPAAARIRAAACVLDQAAKAMEIEDLGVRVSELERAAEQTDPSTR